MSLDYYELTQQRIKDSATDFKSPSADKQAQDYQRRMEELRISSSQGPKAKKHECGKDCKFTKLLKTFSLALLQKAKEHGIDLTGLSPSALKQKLLAFGMPVEHISLELQGTGKNIGILENLLSQHGLGAHLNSAIIKALENRSISSGVAFIEGLAEKHKPLEGQNFNRVS